MKKTILLIGAFALSLTSISQVLEVENFNSLVPGNVGTAIDGSAGQGGFNTFATNGDAPTTTTNAANSNFEIVTVRMSTEQNFNLTGPDGDSGVRAMWRDGLDVSWTNRTAGNDVIELEYTFNTGPTTTSKNQIGMRIFGDNPSTDPNAPATVTSIGYSYDTSTGVLSGIAYLNNNGTFGNFRIGLAAGGLILSPNTDYSIGCSYNTVTGEVLWKTDASAGNSTLPSGLWVANQDPLEVDFLAFSTAADPNATPPVTANTSATTLTFKDYVSRAVAVSNLLNNEDQTLNEVSVKVFPNPATDILNVSSSTQQLSSIEIVDLNGRLIKSLEVNSTEVSANIEDLKPGLYILNISSNDATITRKFVKE
ncbi:putative secreted protein (Por secretion system target) [Nonlabens dokdonensis]|jgi:hypothetical protein|uniref:Outer membrane autotransporter barrel protein n=2 Tax=Nonlabens dokdonensis TaxID=328515 RepID=L7WA26_NONDD|nr:T9SS type A sorting domain-containing protein [Nonlabens dokdonensis]AGC77072.1 outer membrane autotransporter barrel protein [Nonlabens dokdonensis DSW-6]PZX41033.1 putative secreted protein (Por secretion system target) [Nonlabens dokdonensis]